MIRAARAGGVLVLLAVVAVRFAEPLVDSDLFFHLAYARQILDRGTLIPDHALYSWTPSSNAVIYCTWLADLVLLGLWNAAGLTGVFALRYGVVLAGVAMLLAHARRTGWAGSPLLWPLALFTVLASALGTIVKPEFFSLVLFHALVFAYFAFKTRAREGRVEPGWVYAVPAALAVWVNVHGGFVMAAPLLLATAAGEALNRRFFPASALPPRAFGHLLAAWGLTGIAVLLTPYGWRYPWQLVNDYLLRRTPRPDEAWNAAHQPAFSEAGWSLHLPEFLVVMAAALGVVLWLTRRRFDAAVALANLAFVPFFLVYLRTTFFLPVVFAYSVLYLAGTARPWLDRRLAAAAALLVTLLLGGRAIYEPWRGGSTNTWLGFGVGYQNPVMEAEYLAEHALGPRLYNTFDSGAYLLWRLHPAYRVMTDARSFPYLSWFDDQYRFTQGETFDAFLAKYPADTAVIDLEKAATWNRFLRSPDWRPVFYGPTSAIFVRGTCCPGLRLRDADPRRFAAIRNPHAALRAFSFAAAVGDRRGAWALLDALERLRVSAPADVEAHAAAHAYRRAHGFVRQRRYVEAIPLFDRALKGREPGPQDLEIVARLVAIRRLGEAGLAAQASPLAAEVDALVREGD